MSSGQDDPLAILRTQDNHAAAGLPSSQDPQRPGGANDGTLRQEDYVSASCNPSTGGAIEGQITAPSNTGTKRPRKSVKASLQAESSSGNVPSASTSASSAKKPVKRVLKKSKKLEADALKNGEPAASTTFRFILADDTLGSPAVSGASTSFTGAPLEPREGVAPLVSAEHVGTTGSIVQPPNPPRKRGRKKAIITPSTTLLPQDGSSSVSVKEEQVTALSANGPAPKKTKKASKEQKTWKVVPNSRESLDLSRQASSLQSVTDPASGQENKACSIPRIWTSGKTELLASLPTLGPARCVNGFSWTHSHTPFVVLDDGPRSTRPVDLVQLDTKSTDEFIFDLFGTRALVTVGGSVKTNIAEAFEPIPVLPDVGSSTIPSISTSSKRVHFAEGTKADEKPTPPSAEVSSSNFTATLPLSPPVEGTTTALDTSHAVPEAPAASEQVDMPPCPSPPSPPPQEINNISIVSDDPFDRIRQALHRLDQGALELASHFKVALPLDLGGDGETDTCSSIGGEGGGLTGGPERAVAGEVKQENRVPQLGADKPMDIDIEDDPLPAAASSPLTELSSEDVEACKAEDRMDVDVDQRNSTPSTSTSASSSKAWTLPCGCGRNWVYADCTEHFPEASLLSSMASLVPVDVNGFGTRPKRKAAVQTSIRIQDQAKKEGPRPRRSKAEVKQGEVRVKAEVVKAVIANTVQPEFKSEPELKGKGRGRDVTAVESPVASVRVKVAKQPRKGKVNVDAVNKLNSIVPSRLSTWRKRKGGDEDGIEAVHAAPETEEPLPLPSPRKRRRKNAADEVSVAVPPPMAASSSSTSVPEPASKDGQLASAPAPALSSEGVVENQPLENGASQPPHVNELTDTSMANPSSLQPETEPQSASTCASGAFSSEPVTAANLPPSDVVMAETEASLAKDDPPPAGAIPAIPAGPSPPSAPAETSASAEKSIGGCDPLPSLPAEIRALIDAYVAGTPLAIMASRARILELFSRTRPQLDLQEEYGFACLGLFKILGLEERIVPSTTTTAKAASSAPVHVEWKFRVQWKSGGEDILKQKHSEWELARPWWTIPQKEPRQGTSTPCRSGATEANAVQPVPVPPSALQSSLSPEAPPVPSQSTSPPAPAPKDEAECPTTKDKESPLFKIDTPTIYLHVRESHSTYGVEHTLIESGFYSLVPESLLSLFASFLSNEAFPSGWFCTACGKINFQAAMRHRKCSSLGCSKDTTPALSYTQELPDIRGVFSDSPSCLPFNDYAQDVRGSSTSWSNGMRTLGYHFNDKKTLPLPLPPPENTMSNLEIKTDTKAQTSTSGEGSSTQAQAQKNPATATSPARDTTQWVKHVYTCNLPHLQKAASELVRRMQSEVELRRPMGDGSNPFFERTHDLAAPISGSNDEVVTGVSKEEVPACLVDAGKLLFKRATAYAEISKERMVISRLNALAWITAGTRKNQDILYAKKHPIAILCLGCDVIITLTPKKKVTSATLVSKTSTKKAGRRTSRKGKEPEVQPEVQLDMSTLIPFEDGEKPLNVQNEKENQGEEEELPEGGLGAEADGYSGGDNHAPLASSSSSSQFPSVALVTASKLSESTVQVTMVHGDVLVLSGEDYVFSLKRSGCGILVFGSKAV